MSDLWTPSDARLEQDSIAAQHIRLPYDPPDLEANGIVLPDDVDDERIELAAAIALAELDDDAPAAEGEEPGGCEDDDDIEDADADPVAADV